VNVGLPGTGIGAVFYLVSVVIILLRETSLALVGRGSPQRLRLAARLGAMLVGIVVSLAGVDWLLREFVTLICLPTTGYALAPIARRPILAAMITLVAVVSFVNIWGFLATRRGRAGRAAPGTASSKGHVLAANLAHPAAGPGRDA
jgi:hypothetical protein